MPTVIPPETKSTHEYERRIAELEGALAKADAFIERARVDANLLAEAAWLLSTDTTGFPVVVAATDKGKVRARAWIEEYERTKG